MADYPQAVPDLSLEGNKGPPDEPSSDRASIPSGNSGSVSTETGQSDAEEQAQVTVITDNYRGPSTADDASPSVQNQIENRPISDGDLQSAIHPCRRVDRYLTLLGRGPPLRQTAPLAPEKRAPALAGTKAAAVLSAPEFPESLPQQPKQSIPCCEAPLSRRS